jgi:hypothetical protein
MSLVAQIASPFDTAITKYVPGGTQNLLVTAAEANPVLQPLVKLLLSNRVKLGKQGSIALKDILARLPVYLKYIEPDQHVRFVSQFVTYKGYAAIVRQAAFDDSLRSYLRLQLKSDQANVVNSAREEIGFRLKALSIDEWKNAIKSGNEPYPIAGELHKLEPSIEFGSNFYDALNGLADGYLEGEEPPMVTRWFEAITYLNPNNQATQMRGLRDRLLREELAPSNFVVLEGGGAALLDVGNFDEEPDRAVRYVVLPLLATPEGIQWLNKMSARIKTWISNAPPETEGSVEDRIEAAWEKATGEDKGNLETLNNDLDFGPLPKPRPESKTSVSETAEEKPDKSPEH